MKTPAGRAERRDRALSLIRQHEAMALHTTLGVGGPAQFFAEAATEADLAALLAWAELGSLPARVIGTGANLLVSDAGVAGIVVVNRIRDCGVDAAGKLTAGAGALLADVAAYCSGRGWTGLEWATGIPGTLGGAIVGNAGAFGGYMSGVVDAVTVHGPGDRVQRLSGEECGFAYRGSRFKGQQPQRLVLLSAELGLAAGDAEPIAASVAQYAARRESAQPWEPSAGSVFKRSKDHPAGWLIEQVGLKGRRLGGAQISELHANFIVNRGGATSDDVLRLIDLARGAVHKQFGLELELEIEMVG